MTMGAETPVEWSDTLEKDFDKAFVALDMLLGEIDSDQAIHNDEKCFACNFYKIYEFFISKLVFEKVTINCLLVLLMM
ncbi:hypothetical protein DICVIV_14499 [Dictyocaulus viviparus]|uniref:Uncharacterized protein n=1 Tax=Dictyocaulus viviparus TaxID=29172 RepID=A0A0D8X742_DICVI|nr:hypothetical protein DICVIV_14499 [Dictyocaulus viviparus]